MAGGFLGGVGLPSFSFSLLASLGFAGGAGFDALGGGSECSSSFGFDGGIGFALIGWGESSSALGFGGGWGVELLSFLSSVGLPGLAGGAGGFLRCASSLTISSLSVFLCESPSWLGLGGGWAVKLLGIVVFSLLSSIALPDLTGGVGAFLRCTSSFTPPFFFSGGEGSSFLGLDGGWGMKILGTRLFSLLPSVG